ncbi:MAG: hypothetical protein AAF828_12930 [Bacteroidota bacterium]
MEQTNYHDLSLTELRAEVKKGKQQEIIAAVFIGFLVGIIIFGVAAGGVSFVAYFIPAILIAAFLKNGKQHREKMQKLREALAAKTAGL